MKSIYRKIIKWYSNIFGSYYPMHTWYGVHICSTDRKIVFPNGWAACINNNYNSEINAKYFIFIHDHNYNYDFNILNEYGAKEGFLYCNNIFQIITGLEKVRKLKEIPIF